MGLRGSKPRVYREIVGGGSDVNAYVPASVAEKEEEAAVFLFLGNLSVLPTQEEGGK